MARRKSIALKRICIDEKSYRRGHKYVTCVARLDEEGKVRIHYIGDGKGEKALDGASILSLLKGEPSEWADRTIFLQWHRGSEPTPYKKFAAVSQRWKLIQES